MGARTFRCPICAADVHVVMRRTGYCLDCAQRCEALAAKRAAILAEMGARS